MAAGPVLADYFIVMSWGLRHHLYSYSVLTIKNMGYIYIYIYACVCVHNLLIMVDDYGYPVY